jgi:transcriptional regulator with GAF, ATPase, and Fis domain
VTEAPKTRFVPRAIRLERPELLVLTGPTKGESLPLPGGAATLGSGPQCDLRVEGLAPEHARLELLPDRSGVAVSDLSGGRTRLNGAPVHEGVLEPGGALDLDGVELRLKDLADPLDVLPSTADHFGLARGRTLAMREVFGVLEALAPSTATLLIMGETGTGKDVLARAVHAASPRAEGPLVTVDCGAIAPTLLEAELFGYERGAFTGAEARREGAFERADGGTLFLDEVGELPLDVQPKLLRALDEREIQRVGGAGPMKVDVRVVAATKRELEEEVRRGRFREDLFFRLAVVPLTLPPLRERRDDIPLLVEAFASAFAERTGQRAHIAEEEVQRLLTHDWPGNVRELRNTVERALWLAQTGDGEARFLLPSAEGLFGPELDAPAPAVSFDPEATFSALKAQWEEEFEKKYLAWLLARADGSLSAAARMAQMDRKHLRNLAKKHGLWTG